MNPFPPEWQDLNVILAHDWLTGMRGGERVLEILCRAFPRAPIYTLICDPHAVSETISAHRITTSRLQSVPRIIKLYRNFLPLFPSAIESLRPEKADLVISTSHCIAKGLIPPEGARHLCYCFTPMRYAWLFYEEYFGNNFAKKAALTPFLRRLRQWDKSTSARVDHFATLSKHVQKRIRDFYGRESDVVYPPVDLSFWKPEQGKDASPRHPTFQNRTAQRAVPTSFEIPIRQVKPGKAGQLFKLPIGRANPLGEPLLPVEGSAGTPRPTNLENPMPENNFANKPHKNYDLIVSALAPYKRIDIAIRAYNKTGYPLKIAGTGTETGKLAAKARKNICFLGRISDEQLRELYRHCRTLIFPGEEDFGIVPVEAQACGRPVVAYAKGGALESIVDNVSGVFFNDQNEESLIEAIEYCAARKWDSAAIRKNAERFSLDNFIAGLTASIKKCMGH